MLFPYIYNYIYSHYMIIPQDMVVIQGPSLVLLTQRFAENPTMCQSCSEWDSQKGKHHVGEPHIDSWNRENPRVIRMGNTTGCSKLVTCFIPRTAKSPLAATWWDTLDALVTGSHVSAPESWIRWHPRLTWERYMESYPLVMTNIANWKKHHF